MDNYRLVFPDVEEQSERSKVIHRHSTIGPTSPMEVSNICLPLRVVAGDLKARPDKMVVVQCLGIHETDSYIVVPACDLLQKTKPLN